MIRITRIKILIAKCIYFIIKNFFRSDQTIITRKSITWQIDPSEALDLSVFLFGSYQHHVVNNKLLKLSNDAIIFDVGANFGFISLQFAKLVPYGEIYAFEPTHYAFDKLRHNCRLNPQLSNRIFPLQLFLSSSISCDPQLTAYSSWKLNSNSQEQHPIHYGLKCPSVGVESITIDAFCQKSNISKLDLIKIDTDGHEWEVLRGRKSQ